MGRLMRGYNKRSPRSTKHQLAVKEANHVNEDRTSRVERDGSHGELPLFASKNSSSFRSNAEDEHLKHVEAGWPLGSQEVSAWASSFRFELDNDDPEKLQAAIAEVSGGDTDRGRELLETEGAPPGGSFRFLTGNQSGYLKPPRQLEKLHGSDRYAAVANGRDAPQSSDGLGVLQVRAARIKAPATTRVPASPGRSEILQRLSDLKAHPMSPRFAPEDAVSYRREKAKMVAVREELHGRLKTSFALLKDEYYGSSPATQRQWQPPKKELPEPEIMSNIKERRRQSNSPSGRRGSPRRPAQLGAQDITPASRFRNGEGTPRSRVRGSERQLGPGSSIQEQTVSIRKQPSNVINSPSPEHALSAPGSVPFQWEEKPGKPKTIAGATYHSQAERLSRDGMETKVESGDSGKEAAAPVERSGSFRFYGRSELSRHSREGSLGRSSRRYSTQEKEAHIDLDASAAAKFLVETSESPSRSPGSSPTNFAVPFKWEATPGRAKTETVARRPNLLQLPPRLAVQSYRGTDSFSRELRASHPFSGFFAPCMTASDVSPGHRLLQYTPSKSLPPKIPDRRRRHGLVGRCSSTPREGCQIRVSRSVDDKCSSRSISEKASLGHVSTKTASLNDSNGPSSPTSILCGPEESSSQASTSNTAFSSGDLEEFTRPRDQPHQSTSKSSSSASYGSIEEEFAEPPAPPPSDPLHSGESQATTAVNSTEIEQSSRRCRGRSNPPKTGTQDASHAPEPPSPSPSKHSQRLKLIGGATSLVEKPTAATPSGHLDSRSPQASPQRPTRLPYTMPSAAEQLLASCSTSGRRQLIQDLSPRLLHQFSGRRKPDLRSPSHREPLSPSPAYAASLAIFSPAAITPQRRKWPTTPPLSAPKPHRRSRIMLSIYKSLKRALWRQRRRAPQQPPLPRLTYLADGRSPSATFRFKTTYI